MDSLRLTKRSITTIAEAVNIALEHIPMTASGTDLTPGRRVFFPIPMKKNARDMADFIYVYAESKLADSPKNKTLGFTEEDVVDAAGFYFFKRDGASISGCTYSIDIFLNEVIKDTSLHNRVMHRINEMRSLARLDESFLDSANIERASHRFESYKQTVH